MKNILFILLILFLSNCKKNDGTNSNIDLLKIGQEYEGGIVAYILQPGDSGYNSRVQHGLIAAPSDQSSGVQWYNGNYVLTGATGKAIGSGKANTDSIITHEGAGTYAARLCVGLTLGGHNDWYLPSTGELNTLYLNQALIGGFANDVYWSSTEIDDDAAGCDEFIDSGRQYGILQNGACRVRAIRSF